MRFSRRHRNVAGNTTCMSSYHHVHVLVLPRACAGNTTYMCSYQHTFLMASTLLFDTPKTVCLLRLCHHMRSISFAGCAFTDACMISCANTCVGLVCAHVCHHHATCVFRIVATWLIFPSPTCYAAQRWCLCSFSVYITSRFDSDPHACMLWLIRPTRA
jgi:hypothetical protein